MSNEINETQAAAKIVSDAAMVAAERVATAAAKAAVESAASAVAAASSASQILAAGAIERLNGIDKIFAAHERQNQDSFTAITVTQKELKQEVKNDILEIKSDIKDLNMEQKKQTKTIAIITGGFIVLSKIPDFISFIHH